MKTFVNIAEGENAIVQREKTFEFHKTVKKSLYLKN